MNNAAYIHANVKAISELNNRSENYSDEYKNHLDTISEIENQFPSPLQIGNVRFFAFTVNQNAYRSDRLRMELEYEFPGKKSKAMLLTAIPTFSGIEVAFHCKALGLEVSAKLKRVIEHFLEENVSPHIL